MIHFRRVLLSPFVGILWILLSSKVFEDHHVKFPLYLVPI